MLSGCKGHASLWFEVAHPQQLQGPPIQPNGQVKWENDSEVMQLESCLRGVLSAVARQGLREAALNTPQGYALLRQEEEEHLKARSLPPVFG